MADQIINIEALSISVIEEIKKRYILTEKISNVDSSEEALRDRQWQFIDLVTKISANHFGMGLTFFIKAGRKPEFFLPRALSYKICVDLWEGKLPYKVLAAYHNKSCTAIDNAILVVTEKLKEYKADPQLTKNYNDIKQKVKDNLKK